MSINNIVCNNNAILDPEKRFAFGKNNKLNAKL